jgi:hypothetical protein
MQHGPVNTATAFLTALNAENWEGAAGWIEPDVAATFQREVLQYLTAADTGPRPTSKAADTHFPDLASLLGGSMEELRALPPATFLARYAQAIHLPNVMASQGLPASEAVTAISRSLVTCTPAMGGTATASVRLVWHCGERTIDRGLQTLPLVLTPDGWRVSDADFTGTGSGRLRLPPPHSAGRW